MKKLCFSLFAMTIVLLIAVQSQAKINPNYTPVQVVSDSTLIFELRFTGVNGATGTAAVKRVLKGKSDDKTIDFTLNKAANPLDGAQMTKLMGNQDEPAIMFIGVAPGGQGGGGAPLANMAYLHIHGEWVDFVKNNAGGWDLTGINGDMVATFNGGTDMLTRATEYILADPNAALPASEAVMWADETPKQFSKFDSPVHGIIPVDLNCDGHWALHITSDGGDRLFKYDPAKSNLVDITGATKLTTKSKLAAWGDFNADGKMDLVSSDGNGVSVYLQGADGTFTPGQKITKDDLKSVVQSLTIVDSATAGKPAVLIGVTNAPPLLWTPGDPVKAIAGALPAADGLGAAGLCLVADFDRDGIPDVIQMFEKASYVYKGIAPGQFQPPKKIDISLGKGTASAFLGDFSAQGTFDIFAVQSGADDSTRLWNNRGDFKFVDTLQSAGELPYKGKTGAIGGMACDFNNDGRQDIFFFYAESTPQLYFSRGFRTFGYCNGLNPMINAVPGTGNGTQGGCMADVAGDGSQAMIIALPTGECSAFFTQPQNPSLEVALPAKSPVAGPITVTAWKGDRCLGAWNVSKGNSEAFFGIVDPGPVTVKWQIPGEKVQSKEVVVEAKPIRMVLDASAK